MIVVVATNKVHPKSSEAMSYIHLITFYNFAVINWIAYALVIVDTYENSG